jgi:diguanylate cyclase (GGDEF)-like protein
MDTKNAAILTADGRPLGQDAAEAGRRDAEMAAVLRRGEVIDRILAGIRAEVLAPRVMQAVLEPLVQATGSEAAAVIDVVGDGIAPTVLHSYGQVSPASLAAIAPLLANAGGTMLAHAVAADGRMLLISPAETRFGEQVALLLCRAPDARPWDAEDDRLGGGVIAIIRMLLEHEAIQRELARQGRTEPLTGLLNRRAFTDELVRNADRLDRDGLPGALLHIDLDGFRRINDACGHEAGDEALRRIGTLLRAHTRPTDLLGRIGGDEFAAWLNGADTFAAAERAEQLCAAGPAALARLTEGRVAPLSLSIGIAIRWPGHREDVDALLTRAGQAMHAVKHRGGGQWRVAQEEET